MGYLSSATYTSIKDDYDTKWEVLDQSSELYSFFSSVLVGAELHEETEIIGIVIIKDQTNICV